jgi:hypothetical protein
VGNSFDRSAFPASLARLAARTGPIQVVTVDLDHPLPDTIFVDGYTEAYVLLRRDGLYFADATINLGGARSSWLDDLRDVIAQLDQPSRHANGHVRVADEELPRISIVVPTIVQRTADLARCLETIENLDYPNFEVLIVDNRTTLPELDPLRELVRHRPEWRVIREAHPGISSARNAGVANATGEIVAFTDDDAEVDPQWLRGIGESMALHPDLDAVTGLVLPAELDTPAQIWFERYYGGFSGTRSYDVMTLATDDTQSRLLRGSRIAAIGADGERRSLPLYGVGAYAAGANMAFRVASLAPIGGFDVALGTGTLARGGEDLAAIIKVLWTNGSVRYEPAAVVRHHHRRDYDELLALMDGEGIGATAMLTSLVLSDPRHLIALISQSSVGLGKTVAERVRKFRGRTHGANDRRDERLYPSALARRELRAYVRGPVAYFRSRSQQTQR